MKPGSSIPALAILLAFTAPRLLGAAGFEEIRRDIGLADRDAARVISGDLNNDGHPDLLLRPPGQGAIVPEVVVWKSDRDSMHGFRFVTVTDTGLPALESRDLVTLADIDNDGHADAVVTRYLDYLQDDFASPSEPPFRCAWLPGHGDGSFGSPIAFEADRRGTTACVTVGDVNRDGLPDVWLGQWYEKYFSGYEAFANDLLLQYATPDGVPAFVRWPVPGETEPTDAAEDSAGRPTYGVVIAPLEPESLPMLLELNYGRRWNRLYRLEMSGLLLEKTSVSSGAGVTTAPHRPGGPPEFAREETVRLLRGIDIAAAVGVDGDGIRHGRYPEWLAERAKADPRFDRTDEPPFRANGNTFDAAVGDIDNDGDFDLFVSTIYHAWAGDSSDRSRFLVNQLVEIGTLRFESPARLSVERLPPAPPSDQPLADEHKNQNQGDIFCELADLDNDGRLDLILCSSDYSDAPPFDERLRIFLQQADGTFADKTVDLGIDQIGAGQPALVDLDADGALDLVVGQTFNRLTTERKNAAGVANGTRTNEDTPPAPRLHVYHNQLAGPNSGLVFRLRGAPAKGVAADAFGAIVRAWADLDRDPATPLVQQMRQLPGPGGHAGKRHEAIVHFGLDRASHAERVQIQWPGRGMPATELTAVPPGTHLIDFRER